MRKEYREDMTWRANYRDKMKEARHFPSSLRSSDTRRERNTWSREIGGEERSSHYIPFPRYLSRRLPPLCPSLRSLLSPSWRRSWVRPSLPHSPIPRLATHSFPFGHSFRVCWRAKWVGWVIHWSQIKGFIETRPMTQQQIEKMTVRDDGLGHVLTVPFPPTHSSSPFPSFPVSFPFSFLLPVDPKGETREKEEKE